MSEPILTVDHLVKSYDGQTNILDNVSFGVQPGEVIVVVGPSGCGKSTLLRCLNGLEPVQAGRVQLGSETVAYGGKNLAALRQRIGMVFQSYELFPHLTVLDNILLAPTKVQKRPKAEVQQEAEALLDRVGLLQKAKSYPRELSGGQKQRVAIVRALCMHPEILLRRYFFIFRRDFRIFRRDFLMIRRDFRIFRRDFLTEFSQVVQVRASPTRPERAEAPSPGQRPGYDGNQQGAL